jgi:hypothetical protein
MTALTKTVQTVIASGTVTAGTPLRGSKSMSTAMGGLLTGKITNGGTGPTVQATLTVHVAHDVSGSDPSTAAAGTVWKMLAGPFGGGTTAGAVSEWAIEIPLAAAAVQAEFSGNTGQNVTGEAILTRVDTAS